MSERTIAAIATPLGDGAVSVIRISGNDAFEVADKVFFAFSGKPLSSMKGYTAAYGEVKQNGNVIDDAVAVVFRAPKSYTGEDVVEISVHGGVLMTKTVLRLILQNGAHHAQAGEFTKRAFLNGKMDLMKAESVMGLISARNDAELRLSRAAHIGKVSQKIAKVESDLVFAAASIAAYSDYPDEDIEGLDTESFLIMLKDAKAETEKMIATYDAGKILREGIDTVIVGKPNVGKSTLMNMLSHTEKSIVTSVAGTTRDVVEDFVNVGDIVLRLADTAGIHHTLDTVESIGVQRAKERIESAQLVLAVLDCSSPLDGDDISLLKSVKYKNVIVIINKSDMGNKIDMSILEGFEKVEISAKNGDGYDELSYKIAQVSGTANLSPDSAVLIGERQLDCANRALDAINEAIVALSDGHTMDAVGVCVDDALSALYELTGKRHTNEVADEIFRKFCVGK